MSEEYHVSHAMAFEDALRAANALYYASQDGSRRPASAGAYMSIVDYPAAEKVLDTYPVELVEWLEDYYNSLLYLVVNYGRNQKSCFCFPLYKESGKTDKQGQLSACFP